MRPTTHTLVVRAVTPLRSGECYTARLDSWTESDPSGFCRPLWMVFLSASPASSVQFTRTLEWLCGVVSTIEARPDRRQGDVWWRFLRFLDNVKVMSYLI